MTIERVAPVRVTPALELRSLDLSGRGPLHDVQLLLLFASAAGETWITSYDSMHLTALPGGNVGFRARLTLACWVDAPLPETEPTIAAIHKMEDHYAERAPTTIGDLDRALHGKAIALTELRVGADDAQLSGIALGTTAREALPKALAASYFRVKTIDFVPRGDCQAFTATLELLRRPLPEKPSWVEQGIFDSDAASHCTPPRAP